MPLIRCSAQKNITLEAFYKEFIPDESDTIEDIGTPMIDVIHLINRLFKDTVIYGLTSHATLLLHNQDEVLGSWLVSLVGYVSRLEKKVMEYYIEYVMPPDIAPWPGALVRGRVTTLEELEKYLIIAMKASGGWSDCEELKNL